MATDLAYQEQMLLTVEQWKGSGLSIKAFCEQNNLRYHCFHYWYRRHKHTGNPEGVKHSFRPVTIQPTPTSKVSIPFAEVVFPAGHQVRLLQPVSQAYLKALIK